ncbi:MAG: hypothetical protein AB8H79_03040 [Myxococcota bacterium]
MPALVTTLNSRLETATALFEQGRLGAALTAFEELVSLAQERSDRATEIMGRAMAARCLIKRRDVDGAAAHLSAVQLGFDELPIDVDACLHGSQARLAMAQGRADLRAYLRWADEREHAASIIDACMLLAESSPAEEQATWLERAVGEAEASGRIHQAGALALQLGGVLDGLGRGEESVSAYVRAIGHQRSHGSTRGVVSAGWAAGTVLVRLESYPQAREVLEQAVESAEDNDQVRDLLALSLAELARVHEAAGDVVEARRLVIRSLRLGREEDLPSLWPERWRSLIQYGQSLELDV